MPLRERCAGQPARSPQPAASSQRRLVPAQHHPSLRAHPDAPMDDYGPVGAMRPPPASSTPPAGASGPPLRYLPSAARHPRRHAHTRSLPRSLALCKQHDLESIHPAAGEGQPRWPVPSHELCLHSTRCIPYNRLHSRPLWWSNWLDARRSSSPRKDPVLAQHRHRASCATSKSSGSCRRVAILEIALARARDLLDG
jgi:hypothetical protein